MLKANNYQLNSYTKGVQFMSGGNKPLSAPIETVQKTIEGGVDSFSKTIDEEKKKKSTKRAITVASSVVVISSLIAMLNPRYSSKLVGKLKNMQQVTSKGIEKNKENFLKSKFYKMTNKFFHWSERMLGFTNNANTAKDLAFKYFCTEEKKFLGVKNKKMRNALISCDKGLRKVLTKPYKAITKGFDYLGKKTVKSTYSSANNQMHNLDDLVNQYVSKLPLAEQKKVRDKLFQAQDLKTYFLEDKFMNRLANQEQLMENIERDFMIKFKSYKKGFSNKWVNNGNHIDKNLTFWAEEILQPQRDKLEKSGLNEVEKLFNNSVTNRGVYDEIFEIMKPHLSTKEADKLNKTFTKAGEKLKKANYTENVLYFDKKRDLILGSAPTDILTGLVGLGLSGLAIGKADTKEEKFSKTLTVGFPAIAGIGTSLATTAMLFSGVKGLLAGGAAGLVVSKFASMIDHHIFGHEDEIEETDEEKNKKLEKIEVKNA